jgi:hypothetical protein
LRPNFEQHLCRYSATQIFSAARIETHTEKGLFFLYNNNNKKPLQVGFWVLPMATKLTTIVANISFPI